jgi:hypothetical protein
LTAVSPNGVLYEPRKDSRKARIERASVNVSSRESHDVGAAVGLVTGGTIGMVGAKAVQDACAVQKIMHQCVDGDHAAADLAPNVVAVRRREQDAGQGHGEDFV